MTVLSDEEVERGRMAAVRRYDVLDSPPDGAFDRITALAARLFEVPISIVSVVDTDRIWFKSHHGVDVDEIPREPGLCASAILQNEPWVLTNAALDPRSVANPLVAAEHGFRFYAGVPLSTHDGFNLGTLCVIDHAPRPVTDEEMASLRDLAAVIMDQLELRLSARRAISLEEQLRHTAESVATTLQASLLPPKMPEVPGLALVARYHAADRAEVGGDFYDAVFDDERCVVVVGDSCGKGTGAAAFAGSARWCLRTVALEKRAPSVTLQRLNAVLAGAAQDQPDKYCTVALAEIRRLANNQAEVKVALGGHPHPLIVRNSGLVEPIGVTGPIVGWRADVEFVDAEATLESGEALVLFTDGLLDILVAPGADATAALQALLASPGGLPAAHIADRLDAQLPVGDFDDDVAFLVVGIQ
ncbi:MAG: phosphoserine phosphatase RsbU/P [Actinomycetota bacterium]|jgi:sigma-B regulation protein RsbU (phosphoserine phosphatase)